MERNLLQIMYLSSYERSTYTADNCKFKQLWNLLLYVLLLSNFTSRKELVINHSATWSEIQTIYKQSHTISMYFLNMKVWIVQFFNLNFNRVPNGRICRDWAQFKTTKFRIFEEVKVQYILTIDKRKKQILYCYEIIKLK